MADKPDDLISNDDHFLITYMVREGFLPILNVAISDNGWENISKGKAFCLDLRTLGLDLAIVVHGGGSSADIYQKTKESIGTDTLEIRRLDEQGGVLRKN